MIMILIFIVMIMTIIRIISSSMIIVMYTYTARAWTSPKAESTHPRSHRASHGLARLLGGSWYLETSYDCTYHPLISPLSALLCL